MIPIDHGHMFVPETPGLGVDIVKEKVLKYQKE
jgi:L-alanine-DL-glutamate epimerase-like enolase superfamily enzyme